MKKNILVVDDNFDDLNTLRDILVKNKYNVEIATNGSQAMDLVEINNFELIFIDIQMPTLSGYDLIRLIKERVDGKVKIGYITIIPKNNVHMKEIDGFVQKPFNNKSLLAEVKRLIGG